MKALILFVFLFIYINWISDLLLVFKKIFNLVNPFLYLFNIILLFTITVFLLYLLFWQDDQYKEKNPSYGFTSYLSHYTREYFLFIIFVIIVVQLIFPRCRYLGTKAFENTINYKNRILYSSLSYSFTSPSRGDLVFIKGNWVERIIALPQDTIRVKNNNLYINDIHLKPNYYHNWNNLEIIEQTIKTGHYGTLSDVYEKNKIGSASIVQRNDIIGKCIFIYYPFSDFGFIPSAQFREVKLLE